ncbi:MAG: Glycosyl hydrolase, family 18 [candidate division WS6 bacterium GW2011_GWF2_39_15]|uniref:chitinase n=1 Tax=candidate division WS6 bacterium GW2011_GWF2_39_15 TaxID=1619100 RepID=A0A0G0Q6I5_9BACT|nr:MAG: Glycosyl hydrolase, family 18 [candidate division WS6 bacterium GW2011_GWF2_39_15]
MRTVKIVYIIGAISVVSLLGVFFLKNPFQPRVVNIINDNTPKTVERIGSTRIVPPHSITLSFQKIVTTLKPAAATKFYTSHEEHELKYGKEPFNWDEPLIEDSTSRVLSIVDRKIMYTNPNNDKEVMGFLPYWQLSKYRQLQYDKLSSISYFSLTCYDNGQWVTDSSDYIGFNSASFTNMVTLAHQNNVKVYLVVKNFHNRSIRDLVANKGGAGEVLINNIVNAVRTKGLDGVNVDFEYIPDSSYPVNTTLRSNFVKWHDNLADRIHAEFPGATVSTDVFGSSAVSYSAYDIANLGATSLDYIMFMTYDYITTSCYEGKKVAPESPLYGNNLYGTPNWNVSSHLTAAARLATAKKVLMGIPYYGIDFAVKPNEFSKYNALANYPNCGAGTEVYSSIVDPKFDNVHNASTIKWNDVEKATWYAYQLNGEYRHGYYDDPRSLRAKYDFVRTTKLGGIGIWALGYDAGYSDLWNVLREKFQTGPFVLAFTLATSNSRAVQIMDELNVDVISQISNNVWEVKPESGLTSLSITAAKKYPEVVVAEFENTDSDRDVNLHFE